MIETA